MRNNLLYPLNSVWLFGCRCRSKHLQHTQGSQYLKEPIESVVVAVPQVPFQDVSDLVAMRGVLQRTQVLNKK